MFRFRFSTKSAKPEPNQTMASLAVSMIISWHFMTEYDQGMSLLNETILNYNSIYYKISLPKGLSGLTTNCKHDIGGIHTENDQVEAVSQQRSQTTWLVDFIMNISFLSVLINFLSNSSCQMPNNHNTSDWPNFTNLIGFYNWLYLQVDFDHELSDLVDVISLLSYHNNISIWQ